MEMVPTAVGGGDRSLGVRARDWSKIALLLCLAVFVSFADAETADVVGPLGVLLGQLFAGSLIVKNAKGFSGRERLAWRISGFGFLIAAAGVLVVAAIGIITGSVPAFGPADLIFVTSYLFILTGFALLPQIASNTAQRTRVFLDGLIGAVSLAAVLWALLLDDLWSLLAEAPFWERLIASTYPVLDVVMLIMLLWVAVRRSMLRFDPRLLFFGVAMAMQAVADMTYFFSGIGQTFEEATPAYAIYLLAATGFTTAGALLRRVPQPREYAERGSPLWAIVAPYTAVIALLSLIGYIEVVNPDDPSRLGLLAVGNVVVGLVVARQSVEIRENRRYVEREREALVSSVSHELRTPLTSVVGVLDVMLEDHVDLETEEQRELLAMARSQAIYMSRIIQDLILLARDGADKMHLKPALHDIEPIIRDAIASVRVLLGPVTVEVEPGIRAVLDADRFKQVVLNLVENAAKYGGPTILVKAVRRGGSLVVEVHDDGMGVPKRFELMVWKRFERGPHRLDANTPGSGIGLAVVQAVAQRHGGRTTYRRSELLGGACFGVELPVTGGGFAIRSKGEEPEGPALSGVA